MKLAQRIREKLQGRDNVEDPRVTGRHLLTQAIVNGLCGSDLEGEPLRIRLVGPDLVGPMGGVSDRITIQVGADRQTARFYIVNVYANGVFAEERNG